MNTGQTLEQLQNRSTDGQRKLDFLLYAVTGSVTYGFALGSSRSGAFNFRPSIGPLSTFINDTSNKSTQVHPCRTRSVTVRATIPHWWVQSNVWYHYIWCQ